MENNVCEWIPLVEGVLSGCGLLIAFWIFAKYLW